MVHTPNFWSVYERLVDDESLSARAKNVVEASMSGEEALTQVLASAAGAAVHERPATPANPEAGPRAFLSRIEVTGFRGIGSQARLHLNPGPGLTLVVGRNGSGKSSFVEGLEVLLTGQSTRWLNKKPERDWKSGWRNLHAQGTTAVKATFTVEGRPEPTTIETRWAPHQGLAEGLTTVRVGAAAQEGGLPATGWTDAIEACRPFLSYNDVSRAWDAGPTALFDTLMSMLGLEDVRAALTVLADQRKGMSGRKTLANANKKAINGLLEQSADPRAPACAEILAKRTPDLDALGHAMGGGEPGAAIDTLKSLREWVTNEALPQKEIDDLCQAVLAALEEQSDAGLATQRQALALAELLERAVQWQAGAPSEDCPVCNTTGVLTPDWVTRAKRRTETHRATATRATTAGLKVKAACKALRHALAGMKPLPPSTLSASAQAHGARQPLQALPDQPALLVAHVQQHYPVFLASHRACQTEATDELNRLEADWLPVRTAIEAWRSEYELVLAESDDLNVVKAAESWLKDTDEALRAEAFDPIADEAKRTWAYLRAQSNVDIEEVTLTGNATKRRVDLAVTVDGTSSVALGVMSQGELHALALALFLPRLLRTESPFGFVMIDDPVQAMDPAKVDGLARVLEAAAKTHQVVVFTHDPRLPAATRRLGIATTVLNVCRSRDSAVRVQPGLDPVRQHIDDAEHLCYNRAKLGDSVVRHVVPGLCRAALEAALTERTWRELLKRGETHATVEAKIRGAKGLRHIAALAYYGDAHQGDKAQRRIANLVPNGNDILRDLKEHAHKPLPDNVDVDAFVKRCRRLALAVNQ